MKWSPTRGKKPVNPDNYSGLYHKGLRPKNRGVSGGDHAPKLSEKGTRNIGRGFLMIIVSFWLLAISEKMMDFFNPGYLTDAPYFESFEVVRGISFFLTLLMVPSFFLGELMMRREFPQRNLILGLTLGPLILIIVGALLYGLISIFI